MFQNTVTFRKEDATIELPTYSGVISGDIRFQMRTTALNGIILQNTGTYNFIEVRLVCQYHLYKLSVYLTLYFCLSLSLFVFLSCCLSVCCSVYHSVCLSLFMFFCPVYHSVCLSLSMFFCLFIYHSICMSVNCLLCLSMCPTVILRAFLFVRHSISQSLCIMYVVLCFCLSLILSSVCLFVCHLSSSI